jgi:hypothetical protein
MIPMRKTVPTISFAVLGLVMAAALTAEPPKVPHLRLIKAARLIDVNTGATISPAQVLVEVDRIKAVGSNLTIPKKAQVMDLENETRLFGLHSA